MPPSDRLLLTLACLSAFVGVAAGAYGAHGAPSEMARELFRTGSTYQLIHALAVFVADRLRQDGPQGGGARGAGVAAWLFLGGSAAFAGSLYILATAGWRWAGPITPLGGLAMLSGWIVLAISCATNRARTSSGT